MGSVILKSFVLLVAYFILSNGQAIRKRNGDGNHSNGYDSAHPRRDLNCTHLGVNTQAHGHAAGEYCFCSLPVDRMDSSPGQASIGGNRSSTCAVFNTNHNAPGEPFCYTHRDGCLHFECDEPPKKVFINYDLMSNLGHLCKASSSQNKEKITIHVRCDTTGNIKKIIFCSLPNNPKATTSVQETTTGTTTVSEAKTTGTIERRQKAGVVAAVVVGMVFLFLLILPAIVYKGMRMSSSNQTPQPKTSTVPNPGYEGSTDGDRRDYADITDSPRPADSTFLGGGERGSTQHDNLTTSQASAAHGMTDYNEYNEIGEQDYNVLFGGKERGIYHQYTMIPDIGKDQRLKDKHKDKDKDKDKGTGHYQELLKDEISRGDDEQKSYEGDAICGARGHLLDVMEKGTKSKVKVGGSAATADHVYQPLLKAAGNKSLDPDINLQTKPEGEGSDRTTGSAHKSFKDCGTEYATMEPDTTYLSLDTVSSPAYGFQSVNKDTSDPDDAVLEPETSIKGCSDQSMDSTHQPLKDCGPEYATLEPDTTNQSLDSVSSPVNSFHSLNKDTSDPDYEPETSINGGSDQSMDSIHQPLKDCGPEYTTLEPDTMDATKQSPGPVSSPANGFQSLNKDTSDPDYAVLEPETSINADSDQSMDSTE